MWIRNEAYYYYANFADFGKKRKPDEKMNGILEKRPRPVYTFISFFAMINR